MSLLTEIVAYCPFNNSTSGRVRLFQASDRSWLCSLGLSCNQHQKERRQSAGIGTELCPPVQAFPRATTGSVYKYEITGCQCGHSLLS